MADIRIPITLTGDDFVAAHRLWVRQSRWATWSTVAIGVLVLSGSVWLLAADSANRDSVLAAYLGMGTVAGLAILRLVVVPSASRLQFARQKAAHVPHEYLFSETGVVQTSELGEARLTWQYLKKWREGEETILLYEFGPMFRILPKRCLAPEIQSRLRELLERHLGHAA